MIVNGNPCYVRSEDVGRALCGLILTTLIFVAARNYRMQTELSCYSTKTLFF